MNGEQVSLSYPDKRTPSVACKSCFINEVKGEASQTDEYDCENRSEPLGLQDDHSTDIAVAPVQPGCAQEQDGYAPREQCILQVLLARSAPSPVHDGDERRSERLVRFHFLGHVPVTRRQVPLTEQGLYRLHGGIAVTHLAARGPSTSWSMHARCVHAC